MLLLFALVAGSSSVWAQKQYQKITSASELVDGAKYLIVSVESSSKYYTIGTVNSNNRTAVEVPVSGTFATATIATTAGSSNPHEIQLIKSGEDWNLYDVANEMYLNGGSTKKSGNNNHLKTAVSVETATGQGKANGVWSISIAAETGVATITNKNNFSIKCNPNNGSPLIASYSSGQTSVCLYREIAEPVTPITSTTWNFSNTFTQATALNGTSFTVSAENTLYDTNLLSTIIYSAGTGDEMNADGYLKHNGTTSNGNKRYFILEIANSGTLELFSKATFGTYAIKKAATASTSWSSATDVTTIAPTSSSPSASAVITYDAEKPYLFIGLTTKAYTQKIIWTPTTDNISLTTTANMAGWRTFYDASQGYTLDANTTAYVATAKDATKVTLTEITDVPAGTPVLLKTAAAAEANGTFKIMLTKATTTTGDATGNLLAATTANQDLSSGSYYRLGYNSTDGVGFYPYSTATAPAGIVVINTTAGARALTLDFGDATAIEGLTTVGTTTAPRKVVKNGRVVIETAEGTYTLSGARIF